MVARYTQFMLKKKSSSVLGKVRCLFFTQFIYCQLPYSAIKSPQVLVLSGIGRPDILSKIGVDLKIDLPGVEENIQEHNMAGITIELDPNSGHQTLDLLRDPEYAANALMLQCVCHL
jgi:hypothetical protein